VKVAQIFSKETKMLSCGHTAIHLCEGHVSRYQEEAVALDLWLELSVRVPARVMPVFGTICYQPIRRLAVSDGAAKHCGYLNLQMDQTYQEQQAFVLNAIVETTYFSFLLTIQHGQRC